MVRPVRGALSQACTARAARRNEQGKVRSHLLMVAVAAQHVSVRIHFFRLTYMCVCAVSYRSRGRPPNPPLRCARLLLQRASCRRHRTQNYWPKSTGGGCCKTNSEMVVAPPRPLPSSSTSGSATRGSGSDPPGPAPPVRHLGAGAHARRAAGEPVAAGCSNFRFTLPATGDRP